MSRQRRLQRPAASLVYLVAPEICVEVRSPANSKREILAKFDLYFDQDAIECWMCDKDGSMIFYDAQDELPQSNLCPEFPAKLSLYA